MKSLHIFAAECFFEVQHIIEEFGDEYWSGASMVSMPMVRLKSMCCVRVRRG